MKYLGINPRKLSKELHEENYKTLWKELEEKLNKSRDISYPRVGSPSVKMLFLSNLICRFKVIPLKNPSQLFCGYQQIDSKAYMERQETQNSRHNIEGEQSCRIDTT